MFDILMYLFQSYFYAGTPSDAEQVCRKLSAAGFDDDDIHRALDWLSGLKRLTRDDYPAAINHSGLRCMSAIEIKRISTDALNFLVFLEQNKIITAIEREMILDRAVALGRDNLALDKIKIITLLVLWNQHDELDAVVVEHLLVPVDSSRMH